LATARSWGNPGPNHFEQRRYPLAAVDPASLAWRIAAERRPPPERLLKGRAARWNQLIQLSRKMTGSIETIYWQSYPVTLSVGSSKVPAITTSLAILLFLSMN
jgi:hypothetical protein